MMIITEGTPLLKSKVSNFDVVGAVGRAIMVDNLDGRVVVFIEGSRRLSFVGCIDTSWGCSPGDCVQECEGCHNQGVCVPWIHRH